MLNRDPLPNDEQRQALCDMIHAAFVEIRSLGWDGKAEQAGDLADAFHTTPKEMYGWGCWQLRLFRGMVQDYQDKYHAEDYFGKCDYVAMIDRIFGKPEKV